MFQLAIITASDKGAQGLREDQSGEVIKQMMTAAGYTVVSHQILPDERSLLSEEMVNLCDTGVDVI